MYSLELISITVCVKVFRCNTNQKIKKSDHELDFSHCDDLTFFQYSGRTDREIRARKDLDKYRQNFPKTDNFFPFIYLYPYIDGLEALCRDLCK